MYAQKALGVWGVAEPAALIVAHQSQLVQAKRKYNNNVTIAIAHRKDGF